MPAAVGDRSEFHLPKWIKLFALLISFLPRLNQA